jgi:hypothetical protein
MPDLSFFRGFDVGGRSAASIVALRLSWTGTA